MRITTLGAVTAATYGALLVVWLALRPIATRVSERQPLLPDLPSHGEATRPRSDPLTAADVVLVFLANIGTMLLVLGGVESPRWAAWLARLRLPLPRVLNLLDACLFVANGVWGLLVLIFNPGYTPFYAQPKRSAQLATRGPYAIVRPPRYAAEASLNIILATFTGLWLLLLGLLGWPALRRQAQIEEAYLLLAAPVEYARYMGRTGALLPRLKLAADRQPNATRRSQFLQ